MSIKELYEKYKDKLFEQVLKLAIKIESLMKKNAPVGATGVLKNSINTKFVPYENGVLIEIGSPIEYASYVEFGTKPHMPPHRPIELWVERVIQPHIRAIRIAYEESRAVPVRAVYVKNKEKAIQSVTWAIKKKIAKFGTKEQKFVRKSLDELGLKYNVNFYEGGAYITIDWANYVENQIKSITI